MNADFPDPDKAKAMVELSAPRKLNQLMSFLKICSWFRHFVSNCPKVAEPLSRLSRKKVGWIWGNDLERAFQKVKLQFTEEPTLQQAGDICPFNMRTDDSAVSLGACLLQ